MAGTGWHGEPVTVPQPAVVFEPLDEPHAAAVAGAQEHVLPGTNQCADILRECDREPVAVAVGKLYPGAVA